MGGELSTPHDDKNTLSSWVKSAAAGGQLHQAPLSAPLQEMHPRFMTRSSWMYTATSELCLAHGKCIKYNKYVFSWVLPHSDQSVSSLNIELLFTLILYPRLVKILVSSCSWWAGFIEWRAWYIESGIMRLHVISLWNGQVANCADKIDEIQLISLIWSLAPTVSHLMTLWIKKIINNYAMQHHPKSRSYALFFAKSMRILVWSSFLQYFHFYLYTVVCFCSVESNSFPCTFFRLSFITPPMPNYHFFNLNYTSASSAQFTSMLELRPAGRICEELVWNRQREIENKRCEEKSNLPRAHTF